MFDTCQIWGLTTHPHPGSSIRLPSKNMTTRLNLRPEFLPHPCYEVRNSRKIETG